MSCHVPELNVSVYGFEYEKSDEKLALEQHASYGAQAYASADAARYL